MAEFLTMPKLSPTMTEGVIGRWLVQEGDKIEPDTPLFEATTDKAVVEHTALDTGYIRRILVEEGQKVAVAAPIAILAETCDESIESLLATLQTPAPPCAAPEEAPVTRQTPPPQRVTDELPIYAPTYAPPKARLQPYKTPLSPRARRVVEEKNLDCRGIVGSGLGGTIVEDDLQFAGYRTTRMMPGSAAPGSYRREKLSPVRTTIAERLQASKRRIPHFYLERLVSIARLNALRHDLKADGIPLTVNDLLMRAVSLALRQHPCLNVGYDEATQEQIFYESIDLAVAVQTPQGLLTPILWQADQLSLLQLAQHARLLFQKARDGVLDAAAIMGGSFTLSNLGGLGVHKITPIINPPQGAILGVGAPLPTIAEPTITLTLGADHRLIDGADGAAFLHTIATLVEKPAQMLIE